MVMAYVYTIAGEFDRACDELETALSVPSLVSAKWLRVEPLFDPLRDHLRFHALLKKYGSENGT